MDANVWAIRNDYKITYGPTDYSHTNYYVQVVKGNKKWRSKEVFKEYDACIEVFRLAVDLYNKKK